MIFDGIFKRAPTTAKSPGAVLTLESADGWFPEGYDAGISRDKAMKMSAVNRCVEVLSGSVAALPLYLMEEGTKRRITEHALGGLLWGRANEAMTRFDYEKLMEANRLLRGNAYAWVNRDRRTGTPVELIPLSPDRVELVYDTRGGLWYIWTNERTGERSRLSPADVLHYKAYTTDGVNGISVLERAAMTVRTGLDAQKTQESLYANGGRPSGVLKAATDLSGSVTVKDSEGNDVKVSKKSLIRDEWNKIHTGAGNAFRVAVLDNGLEYQPIAVSNSDMQFVESEEVRVADICRFFGVPLHMVYAGKQSYNSNEANSLDFTRYSLMPTVTEREQEDSWKLLLPSERESGLRIKREMKVFLRGDTAAQSAWYKAMREAGVYSVDDIRALEDLEAVPGGETRYASLNYVPLNDFEKLSRARNSAGA